MRGGQIIREARRRSGLTQQDLAERLGTTQSVITRWETGQRSPTLETVVKAVRACGLDLSITLGPPDRDHELLIQENRGLPTAERLARMVNQKSGLDELVANIHSRPSRARPRRRRKS